MSHLYDSKKLPSLLLGEGIWKDPPKRVIAP